MNLNINYGTKDVEGEKNFSHQEITANYILHAINNTHKEGLEGSLRRVFGRIQRKIDATIESKADAVEFEKAEVDLIKQSFRDAKFPAGISKFVLLLEEEIDSLK